MDCLMMSFSKELQQNLLCRFFRWSSVQTAGCVFKEKRNLPYGQTLAPCTGTGKSGICSKNPLQGGGEKP